MLTLFGSYIKPRGELRLKFDFSMDLLKDKTEAPLFSLAIFKDNYRSNENVLQLTGCVLDFDNKGNTETSYDDLKHELVDIEHYAYSTFSNSVETPKWRLVIPYDKPISPVAHIGALNQIIDLIGNPPGIDTACKIISQCYIVPGYSADNKSIAFFTYNEGKRFQPDICDPIETIEYFEKARSAGEFGRNQMLSRKCSAMLLDGYYYHDIAEQLVFEDRMLNNTPYFTDKSEKTNSSDCALYNAHQFLLSHTKSLKNKINLNKVFAIQQRERYTIKTSADLNEKKEPYTYFDMNFINDVPGIVGEIAHDILAQATFANPPLALQAALCIVGTLKIHLVRCPGNARTALYTLGTALTGKGKEDPQRYVRDMFLKLQLLPCLAGQPRSFAGLYRALARSYCKSICLWDEIGSDLKIILKSGNASFESKTQTELMKLFSAAGSLFQVGELQENKDRKEPNILHQPGLTIAGFTTPVTLFDAIQGSDVQSGMLPRFLYFKCGKPPRRTKKYRGITVSDGILEALQGYAERSLVYQAKSSELTKALNDRECGPIEPPPVVPYEIDAEVYFNEIEEKLDAISCKNGLEADIYSRMGELIERVALILCNDKSITLNDIKIANAIVSSCQKNFIIDLKRNIANSPFQKYANDVQNYLEESGPKSKRDIQRRLKQPERYAMEIIKYLVECEYVEVIEEKGGKGKDKIFYKIKG